MTEHNAASVADDLYYAFTEDVESNEYNCAKYDPPEDTFYLTHVPTGKKYRVQVTPE